MKPYLWLFMLGCWLSLAPAGFAHGGRTPQLVSTPAGAYLISAWTQPDPPRVGPFHLTIALAANTGEPILDAQIQVEALHSSGQQIIGQATYAQASNKLFYETDLTIPTSGDWSVIILVESPAGSEAAGFPLTFLPPNRHAILLGWAVATIGLVVVASLFRKNPRK